jgi:hypothetical protein
MLLNKVLAKIESQNQLLKSLGLRQLDLYAVKGLVNDIESNNLGSVRKKLLAIEGHEGNRYFKQVFQMFPKDVRVENRLGYKAYDGLNNSARDYNNWINPNQAKYPIKLSFIGATNTSIRNVNLILSLIGG